MTNAAKQPTASCRWHFHLRWHFHFLDNRSVYADRKFQIVHDAKQFVDKLPEAS
jgi:hypothetical protein